MELKAFLQRATIVNGITQLCCIIVASANTVKLDWLATPALLAIYVLFSLILLAWLQTLGLLFIRLRPGSEPPVSWWYILASIIEGGGVLAYTFYEISKVEC